MISQKTLNSLNLITIDGYFELIIDSLMTGQKKEAKELYNKLSKAQRLQAKSYFNELRGIYLNSFDLDLIFKK